MRRRTVLVTGACGFVGSHMVDQLLQTKNLRVRATDLAKADHAFLNSRAQFVPSDLRNLASLARVVKEADVIYHVASLFRYSAAWEDLHAINVEGTRKLCQAAADAGVSRMVLVSSSGIYGKSQQLPVRENDPKRPSNAYERSKWEQEQAAAKACRKRGLELVILRPSPIYGPRNRYGIGTIIRMLAKGQLPIITENLNTLVPLVHVADVVGAAIHLTDYAKARGEAYNIADDSTYRKYDLFSYIAPLVDTKIYHSRLPLPRSAVKAVARWSEWKARHISHGEPKLERATIDLVYNAYWFSNAKLKATGYRLLYPDARIGLKDTIDWYKLKGWL